MQKLERRNTYTPTGAPQAHGNCDPVIKHGHNVQVLQSLKTLSNNSDVDQQPKEAEQDLRVPVLNMRGRPLMPTGPAKARHLLKKCKAKVVSRKPFTIQLLYASGETKQDATLGVDSGYNHIGISAASNKKELMSLEINLRTDIPRKLQEKKMYRRNRRNRKWHRSARFDNRGREDSWFAPSIQHKLNSHIRIVKKIRQLLPVTKIVVEVANFDIQKIKNPLIRGKQYQKGEKFGFWNLREYVLHRDSYNCQHPGCKHKKDKVLVVHHINGKSEGATDRPRELITLHEKCHKDHHNDKNTLPKVKIKQFKPETFMTIVRWKLVNKLRELFPDIQVEHTYGYVTKHKRIRQKLPKSHSNDAFVIADGDSQQRCKTILSKQIRRNNRGIQLNRKGFKPSIRRQRYNLQPKDIVRYNNREYRVKGVHCKGSRVILSVIKKSIAVKKIELIYYGKSFFHPVPPLVKTSGFPGGVL